MKYFTPRTAHELAHLLCIAQAFKTCADELPPKAQTGGNMCSSCSYYSSFRAKWASSCSSHSSPWENMGRWAILHIAQALKTCAVELSPIAQAGENMCSSCSSYSSLERISVYELSSIAQALKTCANEVSRKAQAGKTRADELLPIVQALKTCVDELSPI